MKTRNELERTHFPFGQSTEILYTRLHIAKSPSAEGRTVRDTRKMLSDAGISGQRQSYEPAH